MVAPLLLPVLIISHLLAQLLSPTISIAHADCSCDSGQTFGFVKLMGSVSQRQFTIWIDYADQIKDIEVAFRRHYFQLEFPYQIGMEYYRDTYKFENWRSLLDYGFSPATETTILYKLFNRTLIDGSKNSPVYLPDFYQQDFQLVNIVKDQRQASAFWVDFNDKISNVIEVIGKRDGRFYVELQYNMYTLDPTKSLADYRFEKNVTLTARTEASVHYNYY